VHQPTKHKRGFPTKESRAFFVIKSVAQSVAQTSIFSTPYFALFLTIRCIWLQKSTSTGKNGYFIVADATNSVFTFPISRQQKNITRRRFPSTGRYKFVTGWRGRV
jgi:hypothetical protein